MWQMQLEYGAPLGPCEAEIRSNWRYIAVTALGKPGSPCGRFGWEQAHRQGHVGHGME